MAVGLFGPGNGLDHGGGKRITPLLIFPSVWPFNPTATWHRTHGPARSTSTKFGTTDRLSHPLNPSTHPTTEPEILTPQPMSRAKATWKFSKKYSYSTFSQ